MIIPNVPGGSWVASSLYFSMDVDSLRWADGRDVVWDRSDDDVSTLWVRLPDDAAAGAPLELTVWYEGDILERTRSGFYYLRTTQAWLPRFGASESTFDLTFRTRDDWPVMSVGTRVARDVDPEDDDIVVSRWVTTRPSSQVTFSVGDFEEYEFPAGQTVPIRIHVAESFHRRLQDAYMSIAERTNGMVNVVRTGTPEGKVHLDIENSLAFFSSAYGPLDFEEYNVAEIPFTHGQAFPGMINLSWVTFEETRKTGEDELFRAHEVAHQWWGIAVSPATYHDRWLAEGLSEFSALWYMHRMRANPIRYFERMQELRERILDARDDARPIWLGSRLGSEYVVTVYSKGAWIFHMLRSLLRNYDTDSEEVFDDLMQTLFTRFNGSSISTEALQAFLEEYLQQDLQWFFDQWVYGSSIPTYRFAYQTTELPTGEVKMTVRVRQEDVPEGFTMPVPVQLVFEGEGTAVVFVRVEGEEVVTELPLLPRVPDAVTFNFMDAVLAEVHEEGW
jgi:aminopeptidase N